MDKYPEELESWQAQWISYLFTPWTHLLALIIGAKLHCHSPVVLLSIQRKTWKSFLSSLAEWAQNSNFITTIGSWLDLEGRKYDPLDFTNRKSEFVKTWDVHIRSLSSYYPLRFQPSSRPNLRPRSRHLVDPGDHFDPGDPRFPCSLGLRWSAGLSIWTLKAACGLTF